jgi:4-oxalocrotonate tautomerase
LTELNEDDLGYHEANFNKKNKENTVATLKEQIREAARVAEEQCVHEAFDAMSWLDLALEENPESFDILFDTTWDELSENERQERNDAIRKVL